MLRPTDIRRQPLTQEANVIVPQCHHGYMRRVQILVPGGDPKVFVGESVHPNQIGPNRAYKLAPFPPGVTIQFVLGPDQWLVAATSIAITAVTVIVEYLPMPADYSPERVMPPTPEPPSKANPTRELVGDAIYEAMLRQRGEA